jgi:hypothetical protein
MKKKYIIALVVCILFFVAAIASLPSIIKKENEKMKLENTK